MKYLLACTLLAAAVSTAYADSRNSSCGDPPCGNGPPETPGNSNGGSSTGTVNSSSSSTNTQSVSNNAASSSSASSNAGATSGSHAVATGGMGGSGGAGGAGGAGGTATGGAANASGGWSSSNSGGNSLALTNGGSSATGGSATGGNASGASSTTTVTYSSNVEASRAAYAPDVLTASTAPCRVSWGGSAGWLGGALGIGGSTLDEGCDLRETSRHLYNVGQRDAAVQVMCLHEGARKALEAVGVECKVSLQR